MDEQDFSAVPPRIYGGGNYKPTSHFPGPTCRALQRGKTHTTGKGLDFKFGNIWTHRSKHKKPATHRPETKLGQLKGRQGRKEHELWSHCGCVAVAGGEEGGLGDNRAT